MKEIKTSKKRNTLILFLIIFGAIILFFILLLFTSESSILVRPNEKFDDVVIKYVNPDSVVVDINNRWGPAGVYGGEKNKTVKIGEVFPIACDKDASLIEIMDSKARFKVIKAHESICSYQ